MLVDMRKAEMLNCVEKKRISKTLFWPWSLVTMCTSTKIEGG